MELKNKYFVARKPTSQELALIGFLVKGSSIDLKSDWQQSLLVKDMDDGGMGSLLLFPEGIIQNNRSFGSQINEYQFTDKDGVEVIISLNLDKDGKLFELDLWKTNYSPLVALPQILQLRKIG